LRRNFRLRGLGNLSIAVLFNHRLFGNIAFVGGLI